MPVLTWLGQAGLLVEAGGARILVDPFFSEHEARTYAPLPIDDYGARIDRVLVTHEHLDHLDPPSLRGVAERSPGVVVIAAEALRDMVDDLPFEGVPARRSPRAARRHDAARRPSGARRARARRLLRGRRPAALSSATCSRPDGVAIYHAGDTIADERVLAGLEGVRVDVALLPINGRDAEREAKDIAGNMNAREAVELAVHCGASVLVPIHWDLFAGNTERPGAAADAAADAGADLHVLTLRRGRPWRVALPA